MQKSSGTASTFKSRRKGNFDCIPEFCLSLGTERLVFERIFYAKKMRVFEENGTTDKQGTAAGMHSIFYFQKFRVPLDDMGRQNSSTRVISSRREMMLKDGGVIPEISLCPYHSGV